MDMLVNFPGGKKVNATYKGFTIKTAQPEKNGGAGTAPSPFDLFLSSIGTCAGFYVLRFCQERDIPTDNINVVMKTEKNPETGMIGKISIDINLPEGFPDKYRKAVISSANLCTVKKHVLNAPAFDIQANIG
ncbi:MAG: OsmC family protein [Spirochaetes bacterium]|nr:OsmC family protein [Spirochaetota bacterium]